MAHAVLVRHAMPLPSARALRPLLAFVWPLLSVACGSGASSDAAGASFAPPAEGGTATPSAPGASAEPPPEKEVESDYEAPVATGHFVWVANPKSGRVAYVDAATLQVKTVEAGNAPTYLAAVPGTSGDTTLVINVLSEDATLLHAEGTTITSRTFKIAKQANSLAFSSDGHYAIAWADSRKVPTAPRTEGFQDLTVLDLVAGTTTTLAVGYRPVSVGFAAGPARVRGHPGRRGHRADHGGAVRREERPRLGHAERGPGLTRRLGDAERQRRAHPARRGRGDDPWRSIRERERPSVARARHRPRPRGQGRSRGCRRALDLAGRRAARSPVFSRRPRRSAPSP